MRASMIFLSAVVVAGCADTEPYFDDVPLKEASADAVFMDFDWKGQVYTDACHTPSTAIEQQILHTVGQLNGHRSVGRIDRLRIENVEKVPNAESGGCDITYSANMLVAWGKLTDIPYTFELILPRDTSCLVAPLSNQLGTNHDLERMATNFRRSPLPLVGIGLGIQGTIHPVPPESIRKDSWQLLKGVYAPIQIIDKSKQPLAGNFGIEPATPMGRMMAERKVTRWAAFKDFTHLHA